MSPGVFSSLVSSSVSDFVFFEDFLFTHFSQLILSVIEILVSSLFSNKVLQLLSVDTEFCLQFIFSLLQINYISCVSSVLSFLVCSIIYVFNSISIQFLCVEFISHTKCQNQTKHEYKITPWILSLGLERTFSCCFWEKRVILLEVWHLTLETDLLFIGKFF